MRELDIVEETDTKKMYKEDTMLPVTFPLNKLLDMQVVISAITPNKED